MKEEDAERLSVAIARALQQSRSVSDSEHFDHHKWISAKIERENAMREFWQDMSAHVSKWGAISLITGMAYALWLGVKAAVKGGG